MGLVADAAWMKLNDDDDDDDTFSKMQWNSLHISQNAEIMKTWMNEWMNEWIKEIYIASLKAYKCMINLPRLAEN